MERKETNQFLKPAKIGAILLVAAVIVGVLVMVLSSPKRDLVEPTVQPTSELTAVPSATSKTRNI